jgi:hypothetical protein
MITDSASRPGLVSAVARLLSTGEPTYFQHEGACRHGLRSALVLRGYRWPLADHTAADVVAKP